ncbi:MAG TPA: flavin reductase family protein [Bacteroidales bacterium]|jgi:flavin reductase (DIM6/NTAB) family NADH-FMN oxidoreductase RutF|nr:flavin reductase family protein [Bacteroidales bacterium]MDD4394952.1 flavin reductase family protein [Bacteroidales bacterium]HNW68167.1 flavin reductase family protein [Bacteroidales bacterium]HPT52502.1 flavin reductase family protein [Bacteroidales bacterium]
MNNNIIKKNDKRQLKPGNMLNPVPVVMVSCGSTMEEYNILTVAWCGTVCSDPPMCYISVRPERHSYPIIKKNKEFVINLVPSSLTEISDWCGVRSGKKFNKFLETNLTPVKGQKVQAPLIYESPVNLECVVKEIIPLGSHDMFLAEIVAVNVDDNLFDKKTKEMRLERANLIAYSNGHYYNLGKIINKFGFSVQKKK